MRRIRDAVAMSLDGYIAGPGGRRTGSPWTRFRFRRHLRPVRHVPDRSPYVRGDAGRREATPDANTLVVSRTLRQSDHPSVTIIPGEARAAVEALRSGPGEDILLFGGGGLFRASSTKVWWTWSRWRSSPYSSAAEPRCSPPRPGRQLELTGHKVYGTGSCRWSTW